MKYILPKHRKFLNRNVAIPSIILLFLGTMIILAQSACIVWDLFGNQHENFYYTQALYQEAVGYLATEFIIFVFGAMLFDTASQK